MGPDITHHPLSRADGSATYNDSLHSVIASVNGPVEVQRRDELPEEAAVEVNVRPLSGTGGPRERWLESVVSSVMRSSLLANMHPRTLIQITLQVTKEPSTVATGSAKDVSLLPALVSAAFLGLVDGGLPLAVSLTSVLVAQMGTGDIVTSPLERETVTSSSVHAFAFNLYGEMYLAESAGDYTLDQWEEVADVASRSCMSAMAPKYKQDEATMIDLVEPSAWLRSELENRARKADAWRNTS